MANIAGAVVGTPIARPARSYHARGQVQVGRYQSGQKQMLTWLKPLGMVGLSLYNFVMRIVTLGIHHFWGKTEVRKRLWSAIRINGEPLEYTGTGGELFKGFLIVFFALLMPALLAVVAATLAFGPDSHAVKAIQIGLYIGFLFLLGMAVYRAQRYRLSRTRWRGIRASLVGSSAAYAWTYFWTLALVPLTLGWISPWRSTKLQSMMMNDMRFGSQPFAFTASSRPLYKSYAAVWFVTAAMTAIATVAVIQVFPTELMNIDPETGAFPQPTPEQIGVILAIVYGAMFVVMLAYMIMSAWYRAAMFRHFAEHTSFDRVGFSSTVSAGGFIWVSLSNFLIMLAGALLVTAVAGALVWAFVGTAGLTPDQFAAAEDLEAKALMGSMVGSAVGFAFLLGLGMLVPVAQARATGYVVRNLQMKGTLDAERIAAGAPQDITRGEGLAQAFDVDAI